MECCVWGGVTAPLGQRLCEFGPLLGVDKTFSSPRNLLCWGTNWRRGYYSFYRYICFFVLNANSASCTNLICFVKFENHKNKCESCRSWYISVCHPHPCQVHKKPTRSNWAFTTHWYSRRSLHAHVAVILPNTMVFDMACVFIYCNAPPPPSGAVNFFIIQSEPSRRPAAAELLRYPCLQSEMERQLNDQRCVCWVVRCPGEAIRRRTLGILSETIRIGSIFPNLWLMKEQSRSMIMCTAVQYTESFGYHSSFCVPSDNSLLVIVLDRFRQPSHESAALSPKCCLL